MTLRRSTRVSKQPVRFVAGWKEVKPIYERTAGSSSLPKQKNVVEAGSSRKRVADDQVCVKRTKTMVKTTTSVSKRPAIERGTDSKRMKQHSKVDILVDDEVAKIVAEKKAFVKIVLENVTQIDEINAAKEITEITQKPEVVQIDAIAEEITQETIQADFVAQESLKFDEIIVAEEDGLKIVDEIAGTIAKEVFEEIFDEEENAENVEIKEIKEIVEIARIGETEEIVDKEENAEIKEMFHKNVQIKEMFDEDVQIKEMFHENVQMHAIAEPIVDFKSIDGLDDLKDAQHLWDFYENALQYDGEGMDSSLHSPRQGNIGKGLFVIETPSVCSKVETKRPTGAPEIDVLQYSHFNPWATDADYFLKSPCKLQSVDILNKAKGLTTLVNLDGDLVLEDLC